jgi:hypothetical protein
MQQQLKIGKISHYLSKGSGKSSILGYYLTALRRAIGVNEGTQGNGMFSQ